MKLPAFLLLILTLNAAAQELTLQQADHLASLPLKCLQQEYPNKLGQLLNDVSELQAPTVLHPAFYGCFDWHSSVHGHWSLVYLLRKYPKLAQRELIISRLQTNLSAENIRQEVAYLSKKHEKSFERTYGWTWLLRLQHELDISTEPFAAGLSQNLRPLTDLIVAYYLDFHPKLLYPIRVGTHSNTAFGMSFAWDYAVHSGNVVLQQSLRQHAIRLFANDVGCPFDWEPSGTDFLSPCMEEIGLMRRILSENEFLPWLKKFAPGLFNKNFNWEAARVSDRTDGHLVHLDGLNFSRAANFYALANQYPASFSHLKAVADYHFGFSLPSVADGNYEGEHWLASFALYAFEQKK